jgi:cytochrome c oxidase cbb3-type subunit 4
MDINTLRGISTALALIAFVGVCIWAWSSKRKGAFEEAANLPFDDDEIDQHSKRGSL